MSLKFHEPSKQVKMSKQKRKLIVLIIAACVVLLSSIIVFAWYMSPRQRMLRAIERSDYNKVISIKNKNSDVLDEKTLHLLSEKLTMIELDYREGKMDYETAISQIVLIKSLGDNSLNEVADQLQNTISAIDYSKKAYNQGVASLESGEYGKAIIFFGDVIDSDIDNYSSAQQKRNEAIEKYRDEVIAKANAKAELNDYAAAISLLQVSFDIIPNDQIINAKISEYHQLDKNQNIDIILSDASDSAAKGDLIEAINLIETNITKYDNDKRLTEKMDEYTSSFVRNVMTYVKEKENEKNYGEAIRLLTNALDKLPNNTELSDKLSQVQNTKKEVEFTERKEQLLKEAEEALKNDGYEKAISILQADEKFKNVPEIIEKIAAYKEYLPVSLISFTPTDEYNTAFKSGVKDSRDNSYDNVISFTSDDWIEGGYIEFYTNNKYSKLSFMFVTDKEFSRDVTARIKVYSDDDKCLYSYNEITYKTEPFRVEVDISGAQYIKITCGKESGGYYGLGGKVYVINPCVQK